MGKNQKKGETSFEASDELSARGKFRVNPFIPVMDALVSNRDRRATVWRREAGNFSFLVNLRATKDWIHNGVKTLMQEYPKAVDLSLADELLHFRLRVKQDHLEKENFSHQEVYPIIFLGKIRVAFPKVELTYCSRVLVADCFVAD